MSPLPSAGLDNAQDIAQLIFRHALIDGGVGFEFNVEFTLVGAPGVLAQLCAADLLLDGGDIGQCQHLRCRVPIAIISSSDVPGTELETCMTKWPSRKSGMKLPPRKGNTATAAMVAAINTAATGLK